MEQKELQEFIHFLTRNKQLSSAQQRKRDALLVRDYVHSLASPVLASPIDENEIKKTHNPRIIMSFLRQFTENKTQALKYTTHYWDKNSDGRYVYDSFDDFKSQYLHILNDESNRPISSIEGLTYEDHLYQLVWNFLVPDITKEWSQYNIKVGYNKYLKAWMDKNSNMQPFSMPLIDLPESIRPKSSINGKQLIYFSDVVNVFKRCIEFRDNDLYFTVKRIFSESPDFVLNRESFETLRGRSFYTDTELVTNALRVIASNIFQRPQFPNLDIQCKLELRNRIISLRITQIGSYADKDLNDPKITGTNQNGDLTRIISFLQNLCDFSIISRFRDNGELKCLRIDYLSNSSSRRISIVDESECHGFSYVLNFYNHTNG